jgi:hypothetical protein
MPRKGYTEERFEAFDTIAQLAEVGHERIQESVQSFRISSGYGRVCTTFLVGSEVFGNRDAEQVE